MLSNELCYICPRSPFHDEDHWVINSEISGRQTGWVFQPVRLSHYGREHMEDVPKALSLRLLGWWEELFRWLHFSTFLLSVFKERKGLSLPSNPEKNIKFPLLPEQSTKSRLPVGTKGKCPPVRINPVVSAAFCLHVSWQYRVQNVSGIRHHQKQQSFLT